MTYVITGSCCNDTSCVEVCPVDCIHPTPGEPGFAEAEMLYIHPDECIECGACVDACPVEAVHADYELPDHLAHFEAVNADFFTLLGDELAEPPVRSVPAWAETVQRDEPLRVAVVGSGPSGWFAAEELARTRRTQVAVTVWDRLPTPYGLVRHGVAPDHLETKQVTARFRRTGGIVSGVRLGVEVGRDLSHAELIAHHHAVVYATGADRGRELGVPGEEASVAAAEMVGWYNGSPDHKDLAPELDHPRAVVIGNGNVALDIARVLLLEPEALLASDMAEHAVEAITAAAVEEVVVVGRRGSEHAAFTSPELAALVNMDGLEVLAEPGELASLPSAEAAPRSVAGFAQMQKAGLLRRLPTESGVGSRRLVLRFGLRPTEVLGEGRRARGVRLERADGSTQLLEAGLVVRAVGYRSSPVPGVPFDEQAGRFAHRRGAVLDPATGERVPGTYVTGWAKRGPSGGIGTNRACAAETVATLLDDHAAGRLPEPSGTVADLDKLIAGRGVVVVDQAGWQRIDDHELATGRAQRRPRVKVVDREQLFAIATRAHGQRGLLDVPVQATHMHW